MGTYPMLHQVKRIPTLRPNRLIIQGIGVQILPEPYVGEAGNISFLNITDVANCNAFPHVRPRPDV